VSEFLNFGFPVGNVATNIMAVDELGGCANGRGVYNFWQIATIPHILPVYFETNM
jgi:hypothetical protein